MKKEVFRDMETFFLLTKDGSRLTLGSTEPYVLALEPTSITIKLIRLNNLN